MNWDLFTAIASGALVCGLIAGGTQILVFWLLSSLDAWRQARRRRRLDQRAEARHRARG